FIARIDPATLEIIGYPVRYTFDPACDRFPDVYVTPAALGTHQGEAPFTVELKAKDMTGRWTWDFGDGTTNEASVGKHTYREGGSYRVTAKQGEKTYRGTVRVEPGMAPKPLTAGVRNERELVVTFNEPVQFDKLKLSLDSGAKVESWRAGSDGQTLIVSLAGKPAEKDALTIDGVYDRAQSPHRMERQKIDLKIGAWPHSPDGLVFLWESGNLSNLVLDPSSGSMRSYAVKPRGKAHYDRFYTMQVAGGAYVADDANQNLLNELKKSNALTIEATITTDSLSQEGPARIVSFSTNGNARNFTLGQQGSQLVIRLRTPQTGDNGTNPEATLFAIEAGTPTHVVVTYTPGKLVAYKNGVKVVESNSVTGDFRNWSAQHLVFGDEYQDDRDWHGSIEGVAIYNRALDANEARLNYENYQVIVNGRLPLPRVEVEGKLVARSDVPSLEQINPYREALVVYEYEVDKVFFGNPTVHKVRVAHWAILDGETQSVGNLKPGATAHLVLEPFEENPQLEQFYISDTLDFDLDTPLFYAVAQ
ncbi:MAG: PKD domain-containing protein, partial [Candidatus Poribacteria bacterium]|nr:PKD domain-containing protein [Candidatus Poribacteria bacterium]